jgi:hypothetical protein
MKTTRHAVALSLALLWAGAALAQADPTLDQVYRAAQAGQVEQAQQMMQQVLRDHPGSAKAQYVEAELLARQGRLDAARQALAAAERLSPGLAFANPAAVQNLRRELGTGRELTRTAPAFAAAARSGSSLPWGLLLAIGGGALAAWLLMRMGRPTAATGPAPMPASPGWGAQPSPAWPAPVSPMGPYGTGGVGGIGAGGGVAPGLGSRLAGGLATGLGVGAGVMAAEAIGRSLWGHNEPNLSAPVLPLAGPTFDNPAPNDDMGGADFGVNDPGSWDDAGTGGGSDWDN